MDSKDAMVVNQESQYIYIDLTDKQIEELMIQLTEMKLNGEHFSWSNQFNEESRIVIYFRKVSLGENGEFQLDQEGSEKIHSFSFLFVFVVILSMIGVIAVIYMLFHILLAS